MFALWKVLPIYVLLWTIGPAVHVDDHNRYQESSGDTDCCCRGSSSSDVSDSNVDSAYSCSDGSTSDFYDATDTLPALPDPSCADNGTGSVGGAVDATSRKGQACDRMHQTTTNNGSSYAATSATQVCRSWALLKVSLCSWCNGDQLARSSSWCQCLLFTIVYTFAPISRAS